MDLSLTTLTFYLNPTDKEKIKAAAKKQRMSFSTYCRLKILGTIETPEQIIFKSKDEV